MYLFMGTATHRRCSGGRVSCLVGGAELPGLWLLAVPQVSNQPPAGRNLTKTTNLPVSSSPCSANQALGTAVPEGI